MNKPTILSIKKDLTIPWFEKIEKTVLFHNEKEHQVFYSIKPKDYVTVFAQTTGNEIIVLKQYRPAVEDYTYEFPSGHVEDMESPEQAILRELFEETGCKVRKAILLGELIPDTGRLENRLWAFYAGHLEADQLPHAANNEGIEVRLVSPRELLEMINNGTFNHALDLSVLALALSKKVFKF